MSNEVEMVGELDRLLDAGKISPAEFERMKAEILVLHREEESLAPVEGDRVGGSPSETIPISYKAAFGLGIASVFIGGTIGLLAWVTGIVSAAALMAVKSQRGRWMAWLGLGLGVLFSFMNVYLNGHLDGAFRLSG